MKFVRDQVSNLFRGTKAKAIPARNYLFLCGQNITLSVIIPRHAPQVQQFLYTTQHFTQNVSESIREVLQMARWCKAT